MESTFSIGLKYNIAPHQEYLLQGTIIDSHREILLHRLRGLCDNTDSNLQSFSDHEMVFTLRGPVAQPTNFVLFRVRRALDTPDAAYHIRYLGQPEIGNRPTLVRACFDVACSDNVVQFLNEMGFRLDHEYVIQGHFFHKGRMKVTVSKIFRMLQPEKTDMSNLEPLSPSHLVELSVVAPAGQDKIGEDMKNFAEQLKPLVQLDKIDPKKIPQ
ncbi:mediator of RNA polymerase II transcription subunit 18-like [Gigantopelta aegis]|uniref:mediator of RNA polymerase II transcription subunit 18-like n=1 Tax=Gigantopelta aegis TaxID=1735272 RepID=UPI001B8879F6|nr:mediator of RNA polymerase II transcription subunit 18-like [Gigantopelta aegis]XP_041365818.1 mediator of RNA polymerase II transcription subunit 18-like [Gigantopelta aegis]